MRNNFHKAHYHAVVLYNDQQGWAVPIHSGEWLTVTFRHVAEPLMLLEASNLTGDVILLDFRINLPRLRRIVAHLGRQFPVIPLIDEADAEMGASLLAQGAQEYIIRKQATPAVLSMAIRHARERFALQAELRQSETSLQTQSAQLDTLLENLHEAMVVINRDGTILMANQAAEQLFSRSKQEIIGYDLGVPIADDDGLEMKLIRPNQTATDVMMHIKNTTWEKQPVWVATFNDLSKRLLQQSDYDQLNQRFTAQTYELAIITQAIEASPIGVVICDATDSNFPLTYANPAFEAITGYDRQAVLGRGMNYLQGDDTDQAELKMLEAAIDSGETYQVVIRNYRQDGTMFWNDLRVSPIHDGAGKITHFVGLINDITAQITAQQVTADAYEQLNRSSHHLGTLYDITRQLIAAFEPERIYDVLYSSVAVDLLKTNSLIVTQFDNQALTLKPDYMRVNGNRIETQGIAPVKISDGITQKVIEHGGWQIVKPEQGAFTDDMFWPGDTTTPGAALIIPLVTNQQTLGTLVLFHSGEDAFQDDDVQVVATITSQASIALSNARLFQETQQYIQEIETLYKATITLFDSDDLIELGHQIVTTVVEQFNLVDCGLVLYDAKRQKFTRLTRTGQYRIQPDHEITLDGIGLLPQAVREGRIVYAPDVSQNTNYITGDPRTKSELVIPLKSSGEIIGALDLQSPEANAFSQHDKRVVTAFAERAASRLRVVQLYGKLDQYAADLEWRVAKRTAELENAKNQVETVLHHVSDAIILLDNRGRIEQVNPAFERWFDVESDQIVLKPLVTFIAPDFHATYQNTLDDVLSGNMIYVEMNAVTGDQRVIEIAATFVPVEQRERNQLNIVCSMRDVSSEKALERGLRVALDRERELGSLKENFISMISHEFKTPLAVILSSAGILKNYQDRLSPERQLNKIDGIMDQVHRLNNLVSDVLVLSHATTVGMTFTPARLDLIDLCETVVEELAVAFPSGKDRFIFTHPDSCVVWSDEKLMRHILYNLLSNAAKYSPDDQPVTLAVAFLEDDLTITIQDHGIGIPEDEQKNLFEPFFRAGNVGTISGTGLGLVVVRHAIEAQGGTIQVNSAEGQGTTIQIQLPLNQIENDMTGEAATD